MTTEISTTFYIVPTATPPISREQFLQRMDAAQEQMLDLEKELSDYKTLINQKQNGSENGILKKFNTLRDESFAIAEKCRKLNNEMLSAKWNCESLPPEYNTSYNPLFNRITDLTNCFQKGLPFMIAMAIGRALNIRISTNLAAAFTEVEPLPLAILKAKNGDPSIEPLLFNCFDAQIHDIEVRGSHDDTALLLACEPHVPETIAFKLLERNASITALDCYQQSVLMLACYSGRTELVSKLLDKKALIDLQNHEGYSALIVTLTSINQKKYTNYAAIVDLLISHHANLELVDCYGRTALLIACDIDEKILHPIAMRLLEAGAKTDIIDQRNGVTPWIAANREPANYKLGPALLQSGTKLSLENRDILINMLADRQQILKADQNSQLLLDINACIDELIKRGIQFPINPHCPEECIHLFHTAMTHKPIGLLLAGKIFLTIRDADTREQLAIQYTHQEIANSIELVWRGNQAEKRIMTTSRLFYRPKTLQNIVPHITNKGVLSFLFIAAAIGFKGLTDQEYTSIGLSILEKGIDVDYLGEYISEESKEKYFYPHF